MLLAIVGCDQHVTPQKGTIASATPAATDIVRRLGAADRLVGISRFDEPDAADELPRVGDANGLDWEQLAALRPATVAVGVDPARLSDGDHERAEELSVTLLNAHVVRLDDVAVVVARVGKAVGTNDAAERFLAQLGPARPQTDRSVLVLLDADLHLAAGRRNYIDDLITHVGGRNVIPAEMTDWPSIDAELLASLRPDAVVLLLPNANDATLQRAEAAWRRLPSAAVPAWEKVIIATEPTIMTPGWTGVTTLAGYLKNVVDEV